MIPQSMCIDLWSFSPPEQGEVQGGAMKYLAKMQK